MWFHKHRRVRAGIGAVAAVGAAGAVLIACGPFFPVSLLLMGDSAVLSAPTAEFEREIDRVVPHDVQGPKAVRPGQGSDVFEQSASVDLADLTAALGPAKDPKVLDQYAQVRAALGGKAAPGGASIPAGIPREFAEYLQGLVQFRTGDTAGARARWETLLALPVAERRWRSTWAAFMLGRSYLGQDSSRAITWLRKTRELAAAGCADSLGLASSSLGWEAKAELERGHTPRAVELYLEQLAGGDPTALSSLRFVAERTARNDTLSLAALAGHLPTRRVLTAYLVSQGGPVALSPQPPSKELAAAWLKALEMAGAGDVAGADRAAWAAYQAGDMKAAERWLSIAPADSGIARWIRAKLLLRAGKLEEGAAMLARASAAFPIDETWDECTRWEDIVDRSMNPSGRALGEAGVVLLARRQYTEALDALLRGGFWTDAAYVAERVLTVDELRAYLDRTWATVKPVEGSDWYDAKRDKPEDTAAHLKYVLGRRLARLGKFEIAAPYMPDGQRGLLASLAELMRAGRDPRRGGPDRARSLWAAAQLTREHGMALLGTELAPDAVVYGGSFSMSLESRKAGSSLGPSPDELTRSTRNAPAPDKRWHYRFVGTNLAWEAASLMPDQDEGTATVLCTAGTWIKAQEPKEADRFYKALVKRCGNTPLGAEAAKLHWFPKIDVNK